MQIDLRTGVVPISRAASSLATLLKRCAARSGPPLPRAGRARRCREPAGDSQGAPASAAYASYVLAQTLPECGMRLSHTARRMRPHPPRPCSICYDTQRSAA